MEPIVLPEGYYWEVIDINSIGKLCNFLAENYVEYEDVFRIVYSTELLKWALFVPGHYPQWHISVQKERQIVGFISALPMTLMVREKKVRVGVVDFLCVSKKIRKKRLMPVLAKEITRRISLEGFEQSFYTSGYPINEPMCQARYFHRFINVRKLVDIKFCYVPKNMNLGRMEILHRVEEECRLQRTRIEDIPAVLGLLSECGALVYPKFEKKEAEHHFLSRNGVVSSFVLRERGQVVGFGSYYLVGADVVGNKKMLTAYLYYYAPVRKDLIDQLVVMAKREGADVFNALDIYRNGEWIKDLKFMPGDGKLNYIVHFKEKWGKLKVEDFNLILV